MNRKIKTLGLALVAVFAFSALASASASAALFNSADPVDTVITGHSETDQVFVATATVTCTTGAFKGTQTGATSATLRIRPTYTNCSSSLGGTTTVSTKGCDYVFNSNLTGNHAPVDIECEAGHNIIINNSLCTIYIGTQTDIGQGVTYTNINSKKEVTVNATATSININKKEGPFCFLVGSTGTYTGKAIVKGYADNGAPSGNATDGFTYNEGAQVNVWWE
jgi:hypothetical protein